MTLPSSTRSTAGSVTLEPTSPASLSTVRTSSTDAFSCLPPQRTIAYTENSLSLVRARREIRDIDANRPACVAHGPVGGVLRRLVRRADHREYQTLPAKGEGEGGRG